MTNKREGFKGLISQSLDLKQIREDRSKSKDRHDLFKRAKQRIKTTMIGALSSLEDSFGFLWSHELSDDMRSDDQLRLMEIYKVARADILDKGNEQIRLLELDFSYYEISRMKHFIKLPVKESGDNSSNKETKQ